jgi:predicted DNA binding protein
MTHYEISFRIRYESAFGKFTSDHQDLSISQWCNWNKDYIEVKGRTADRKLQSDVQRLARDLHTKILRTTIAQDTLGVVFSHCICTKVVAPPLVTINRFNCLEMQPYIFQNGSEICRVIAFSQRDIRKLFSSLGTCGEIEMLSRREVEADVVRNNLNLSSSSLLGDLTLKQKQALRVALDTGYYKKPRDANASKVANLMGIPRTSFVDHLRKAENKVLNSLHPFISLESV